MHWTIYFPTAPWLLNILAQQYRNSGILSTDVPDVNTGIDWLGYLVQNSQECQAQSRFVVRSRLDILVNSEIIVNPNQVFIAVLYDWTLVHFEPEYSIILYNRLKLCQWGIYAGFNPCHWLRLKTVVSDRWAPLNVRWETRQCPLSDAKCILDKFWATL